MAIQYKRILLKVSGEALGGEKGTGFDEETIASICAGIKAAHDLGAQIGIVVGGGNFWRGRSSGKMDRTGRQDRYAGHRDERAGRQGRPGPAGCGADVRPAPSCPRWPAFTSDKAIAALESGKIAVFGGGTGNPFFSTDTATPCVQLRSARTSMFKATMVDGVYDKDPHKYPDAERYDTLTFTRCWRIAWLSWTALPPPSAATTACPSSSSTWPSPDNIAKAVQGEIVGTLVYEVSRNFPTIE